MNEKSTRYDTSKTDNVIIMSDSINITNKMTKVDIYNIYRTLTKNVDISSFDKNIS